MQKIIRQRGTGPPGGIMSERRAISSRNARATSSESAYKDLENRSWDTKYRGPLLIHAGRAWAGMSIDNIEKRHRLRVPREKLLRGGVIGVVELVDVVTKHRSRWFDGNGFGWVLKNPRPLRFRKMDGRLGLFEVNSPTPDWTIGRIRRDAALIGPATAALCDLILEHRKALGRLRLNCLASSTTSGRASVWLFLPPHFSPAAILRSRAAFNFATSAAFSNCATAPSTCRIRIEVGVSVVKWSGAVVGISDTPSAFSLGV